MPADEEEHHKGYHDPTSSDGLVLVGLVGPVDESEGDESQDASDGPGGEEDGILSFGFIPLLGEEGDDGPDTAHCKSGVEECEGVDGQVEA